MPVWNKEFLEIQATIECRFTLKYVCEKIITYKQKSLCSQHSGFKAGDSKEMQVILGKIFFTCKFLKCG